ncbi:hypothetical protein QR680_017256 [Steinernema hermaphroditum]|uniref:LEM domain-containing protein n=1 Tax=Steinernema hermaphroditum TaxID=289476 RepID=A0AA39LNT8_9BILA|nr:hypothetical protein QR680_017256 [Steinernema hermaphroditum]
MADVASLSDAELRKELATFGYNSGAVTGTTRKLYEKKLLKFRSVNQKTPKPVGKVAAVKPAHVDSPPVRRTATPPKSSGDFLSVYSSSTSKVMKPAQLDPPPARRTISPPKASDDFLSAYSSSISKVMKPAQLDPPPARRTISPPKASDDFLSAYSSSISKAMKPPHADATPVRRTLTPPRASAGLLSVYSSSSSKGFNASLSNLGDTSADETDDDGHTESCRTIDPTPTRLKNIKYGQPTRQLTYFKVSPPTPASLFHRVLGQKKKVDSFDERFRSMEAKKQESPSIAERVGTMLMAAVFVMVMAYTLTHTNPETVYATAKTIRDIAVFLATFAYSYAIIPALFVASVIAVAAACYYIYQSSQNKRVKEHHLFTELVDKITELIREADEIEGIAEPHVRDMIYPPSRRTDSEIRRWERATRFINEEDSRVRTDVRLLNGVECNVWVWVAAKNREMANSRVDAEMTIEQLRAEVAHRGHLPGSISSSNKSFYLNKLNRLREQGSSGLVKTEPTDPSE